MTLTAAPFFLRSARPRIRYLPSRLGPHVRECLYSHKLSQGPLSYVPANSRTLWHSHSLKLRNYNQNGYRDSSNQSFSSRIRGRLDRINGNWLVYGIIGINVGVWVAFLAARASYETGDARPLRWLFNNMTCSAENLKQGRVWTLITSAFAHQAMEHIFMNSLGLWMFCPAVATSIGAASFLQVYLAGAIGCDLFSLWWNQNYNYRSLGASGALCAIMSFTACLNPRASVLLYGIVPMPLYGVVIGIFLYDLYGARNSSGGGKTDFAGHLGGTLTGIGVYFLRRRLGMRF